MANLRLHHVLGVVLVLSLVAWIGVPENVWSSFHALRQAQSLQSLYNWDNSAQMRLAQDMRTTTQSSQPNISTSSEQYLPLLLQDALKASPIVQATVADTSAHPEASTNASIHNANLAGISSLRISIPPDDQKQMSRKSERDNARDKNVTTSSAKEYAARESYDPPSPSEPRFHDRRKDIIVYSAGTGGRVGHQMKDLSTSIVIAMWMGYMVGKPVSFAHDLQSVLDFSKIADTMTCPPDYKKISLGHTTWNGFKRRDNFWRYFNRSVPLEDRQNGKLCILVTQSCRIHMSQMWVWEYRHEAPSGVYDAVRARLKRALTARGQSYWNSGSGKTHIVVHQRRGDVHQQKLALPAFLSVMSWMTETLKGDLSFHVITESSGSSDVYASGCKFSISANRSKDSVLCQVSSKSIKDDFMAMVYADVLLVTSSGFSNMAALIGDHEGGGVYYLPKIDYHKHTPLANHFFGPTYHPPKYHCLHLRVHGDKASRPESCDVPLDSVDFERGLNETA